MTVCQIRVMQDSENIDNLFKGQYKWGILAAFSTLPLNCVNRVCSWSEIYQLLPAQYAYSSFMTRNYKENPKNLTYKKLGPRYM